MTDQPTPPLHEQVRTLEADLVRCREQLAQETERAESYRLDVAALRDALDAPDDADVDQLIDVVHAIAERAEKAEYAAQQLPTPDATNPAHLRFISAILRKTKPKDVGERDCSRLAILADAYLANADRLEAAQQQADADEELIEKAARVEVLWPNGDAELVGPVRARALHAANLLRDGGEK